MVKGEKNIRKSSRDSDLDKKMKSLSKAVAKQVSIFYMGWFKTAERNSLYKSEP